MDVTLRFYAYAGKRYVVDDGEIMDSGGFLKRASEIAKKFEVLEDSFAIYEEIQQEIEELEEDIISQTCSNVQTGEEKRHRESIIEILYDRLRTKLSIAQIRDVEKVKFELAQRRHFVNTSDVVVITNKTMKKKKEMEDDIPQDITLLQEESDQLLSEYQTDTDQIIDVRRKIQETGVLLSLLSSKAMEQDEVVCLINQEAEKSVGYIESANIELKNAIENNSSYRLYMVCLFFLMSVILIILDYSSL